ncbi:MAG: hypothetical protein MRJ68_13230 [Nitrospira sp.]|nr:hypothetical protein [Nitrospira sp.]
MAKSNLKAVQPSTSPSKPGKAKPVLTGQTDFAIKQPTSGTIQYTIHGPAPGDHLYVGSGLCADLVQPGQTSAVVNALKEIKEIKTIDPCWGKPDIIAIVDIPDQDALTQLVLSRIHRIDESRKLILISSTV